MPQTSRPAPFLPLGRRLADGRRVARFSQLELADRVGVHQTYVSQVERGISRPEPDVLRRFATALSLDYSDLAALAGYVDQQRGEATIKVPADNLDLRREAASLPERVLRPMLAALRSALEQSGREVTALDAQPNGEPVTDQA